MRVGRRGASRNWTGILVRRGRLLGRSLLVQRRVGKLVCGRGVGGRRRIRGRRRLDPRQDGRLMHRGLLCRARGPTYILFG